MFNKTNRLIAIVVILSAALIGGNIFSLYVASDTADANRNINNQRLLESFISDYTNNFITHIGRISVSDTAFDSLHNQTYSTYFKRQCADYKIATEVSIFGLVRNASEMIFICDYGVMKKVERNAYVTQAIAGIVKDLNENVMNLYRKYNSISSEFNYAKDVIRINDRIYLAIVSLVNPESVRSGFPSYKPVISFSLINLEKIVLDKAAESLPFANLGLSETYIDGDNYHYVVVNNRLGDIVSYIRWEKSRDFGALLVKFLPSIILVSLMFFGLIVLYLTRIGMLQNVIAKQEAEARHAAAHDAMTCLPNRASFNLKIEDALSGVGNTESCFVGFFDLDYFKQVNDNYGHDAGDAMIIEAGKRLSDTLGTGNVVARLGGDEFGFIVATLNSPTDMKKLCEKLNQSIKEPFVFAGVEHKPSASFGIVEFPRFASDSVSVLKAADYALYIAKENGRGQFHFYNESDVKERFDQLESEIPEIIQAVKPMPALEPIYR